MTKKRIVPQIIFSILIIAIFFALLSSFSPTAGGVKAEVVTSDWTQIDVTVKNNIDDTSCFTLPGEMKADFEEGAYKVRISENTISSKTHYFVKPGYSYYFDNSGFILQSGYYVGTFDSTAQISFFVTYVSKPFKITYIDSLTNDIISSTTSTVGSTLEPPEAPDHKSEGYVFSGWSNSIDSVQENCTIYAQYAPARYVTIIFEDESTETYAVAKGSKLSEINELDGYKFQKADGSSVSSNTQINDDLTLYSISSSGLTTSAKIIIGVIAGVVGLAIIAIIIKSII